MDGKYSTLFNFDTFFLFIQLFQIRSRMKLETTRYYEYTISAALICPHHPLSKTASRNHVLQLYNTLATPFNPFNITYYILFEMKLIPIRFINSLIHHQRILPVGNSIDLNNPHPTNVHSNRIPIHQLSLCLLRGINPISFIKCAIHFVVNMFTTIVSRL